MVSEVSGYVKKIHFKENQKVKKGDTIIEVEQKTYRISYNQAKAHLDYLSSEMQRYENLRKQDFISQSEFEKFKSSFEVAKENFEMAKYKLENTTIKSKNDGFLSNFEIKEGDYINERRPLFNIIDNGEIWVEANFKEIEVKDFKVGQKATIRVDAFNGKKWNAKISSIRKATNSEFALIPSQSASGNWIKVVQRILVKLDFEEGQDLSDLSSGMSVDVSVDTKSN
jgi:membrane fusion protein (multidrug efflux system)